VHPAATLRGVLALLRSTHPLPSVAVTVFACALAVAAGRGWHTVWVAAAVLAGQVSVGLSNDWIDAARDRAAGRADKPVAVGAVRVEVVRAAALTCLAVAVALSLVSGLRATAVHVLALGFGWAYNLGLKGTALSVVPYAVAFGLLPAFVTLGPPLSAWPAGWAVLAGGLLGAGAHFANVLPDLEDDRRTGVRGLPHRLGSGGSTVAAVVLLAAGGLVVAGGLEPVTPPAAVALGGTAATLAAMGVAWGLGRRALVFRLAILAAGGIIAALVAGGGQLV
jgi:4-hydroxybenzoate polyprenyltransferase